MIRLPRPHTAARLLTAVLGLLPLLAQGAERLPTYEPRSEVRGVLSAMGSDTMNNLMTLWAEAFQRRQPGFSMQIQGAGSSTAPTALTEGIADFGAMSRPMKNLELQAFEARHGHRPTAYRVAMDALAIFVHKDNPLPGLTLAQIDALFSVTRRCGHPRQLRTWDQLGLGGGWRDRPVSLYGRNAVSGTYGYFKDRALCRGDFLATVNEQPGSASVVQAVSASIAGIGYSGIGYANSGVRAVPIALRTGRDFVSPSAETALSGRYPLTRYLLIYVNRRPDTPLAPPIREFLEFVLSGDGQDIIAKDGYIPLPAAVALRERGRLQ